MTDGPLLRLMHPTAIAGLQAALLIRVVTYISDPLLKDCSELTRFKGNCKKNLKTPKLRVMRLSVWSDGGSLAWPKTLTLPATLPAAVGPRSPLPPKNAPASWQKRGHCRCQGHPVKGWIASC